MDQEKDLVVAAAEEEEEACKGDLLTRTAKVNMDRITNRVHAAITARLWATLRRIVTRSMAIQAQETRTMTKKEAKQTTPSSLHQNLIPRAFLPSSPTQAQPNTCVIKRDFSQHLNQSRLVTGPCLVKNLFCLFFFPKTLLNETSFRPGIGNTKLDVLGVGDINVTIKVNNVTTSKVLHDVLYVAGLGVNLFSIGAATATGLKACFENNKVQFTYLLYIMSKEEFT